MSTFPYKTFARKESHPARMGALARLGGLTAANCKECRVLEIGCGNGGNIIPLALSNPNSTFIGIDKDTTLIEAGRALIVTLGLTNIELLVADIAQYNPDRAFFDYVICHGVYSWVSEELQQRILAVIKSSLAPQGVGFVSYNTLPGWRQRGIVRDILHVGAILGEARDDASRYAAGMSLLKKLTTQATMLPSYVNEAAQRLLQSEPSYVVQEFLGDHNSPALFIDFMRGAQDAGLQFLSEARVVMMSSEDLSPELKQLLESSGEDIWMREQLLDLIRNRTFRETLLCHDEVAINRGLSAKAFKELTFVANYTPHGSSTDASAEGVRYKERSSEREVLAPHGECERLLRLVARHGAAGIGMAELAATVTKEQSFAEHELMRALVTLWKTGFIDAVMAPLCGLLEEAKVSALARMQALSGEKVTSLLHESFDITLLERRVLGLLDRSMTFQALETLALRDGSKDEVVRAIRSLQEKGFFY